MIITIGTNIGEVFTNFVLFREKFFSLIFRPYRAFPTLTLPLRRE